MTSEADIARATGLVLDRLELGYIAVENDRELHREIGADRLLSITTVKRAMGRLIRDNRVKKQRRPQPDERGMGPAKTVYELRRSM